MHYKLPSKHALDWFTRCGAEIGAAIVNQTARTITIEMDSIAYADLKADAEYYRDEMGKDNTADAIDYKSAAISCLVALDKYPEPEPEPEPVSLAVQDGRNRADWLEQCTNDEARALRNFRDFGRLAIGWHDKAITEALEAALMIDDEYRVTRAGMDRINNA